MVRFARSGGLWPPPQSIYIFSHRIYSCCVCSPTEATLLAESILPQISQNSQNFLLRVFSHRFHRIHRTSC